MRSDRIGPYHVNNQKYNVHIQSAKFFQFRNLQNTEILFNPVLNIFVGLNGQGKTNLVEGLSYLSASKSFRGAKSKELIRWDEKEGSVFAKVSTTHGDIALGAIFSGKGRQLLINNNKASAFEFIGKLISITFSPTDIEIIKGPPAERRRFLDKHMVDIFPQSFKPLLSYISAIEHKNALLKDRASYELIEPWNKIAAREGWKVIEYRRKFVDLLSEKITNVHPLFAEDDGLVALTLKSTHAHCSDEESFFLELKKSYEREFARGSSIIGPHKDDLEIQLGEADSRLYASQGQSKSLSLSLKLSAIYLLEELHKESPVVILDDLDSELDRARLGKLYKVILNGERQVFITTTELSVALPKDANYSFFSVKLGTILKSYVEENSFTIV